MPQPHQDNAYPKAPSSRTRWIVGRRPDLDAARRRLPVDRPGGWHVEAELLASGTIGETLTVFLTNRECPWRCLMCDLWQHSTLERIPVGAIPRQIRSALGESAPSLAASPPGRQLKLYNAGSFFDAGAIPRQDWPDIARLSAGFRTIVVENHPNLVGPRCAMFLAMLERGTRLEVALGLETAHPDVLDRLNKRFTLDRFRKASHDLKAMGMDVRVFVLVQPPFLGNEASLDWGCRSIDFAFDAGADVVSLIPTRPGNGAIEELARQGEFLQARLDTMIQMFEHGLGRRGKRVFMDLWDIGRILPPGEDPVSWKKRLTAANLEQRSP